VQAGSTGCPGQWWSPHPWRGSKNVWILHFGTWFSRHGGVGWMVELDDVRGLFKPSWFYDSMRDGLQMKSQKTAWKHQPAWRAAEPGPWGAALPLSTCLKLQEMKGFATCSTPLPPQEIQKGLYRIPASFRLHQHAGEHRDEVLHHLLLLLPCPTSNVSKSWHWRVFPEPQICLVFTGFQCWGAWREKEVPAELRDPIAASGVSRCPWSEGLYNH